MLFTLVYTVVDAWHHAEGAGLELVHVSTVNPALQAMGIYQKPR